MRSIFRPAIFGVALVSIAATGALAQTFPTEQAHLVAEKLTDRWGQTVLIENIAGAAGNIGAETVPSAPADGHVLLLNASSHVINGILYSKLPYDPFKDFTPIAQMASCQHMFVVHPSVTAKSIKDFVAFVKAKPGQLTIGNSGIGTPGYPAAELFKTTAGIEFIHVPYKGSAPATTDLLGGQLTGMFNNPVNTLPCTAAGKLKAPAVAGKQRLAVAPEVPTVAESGYPGFEAGTWFGVYGPAQVPAAVMTKICDDMVRVLRLPDVQQKLNTQAWDSIGNTPSEFAAVMKAESESRSKVIRTAGIKAE